MANQTRPVDSLAYMERDIVNVCIGQSGEKLL